MRRAVVVVLAGGYVSPTAEQALPGLTTSTLTRYASESNVAPSLVTLHNQPAVVHTIRALSTVKRVDLSAGVWVVYNERDRSRFIGPQGMFDEPEASDISLPGLHFVSNGSQSPADHQGEVSDLQLALRSPELQSALASGTCMLTMISSTLSFVPQYNMQRVFEHSFVRGKDILGYSILSPAEALALGPSGHVRVVRSQAVPVPQLAEVLPDADVIPGEEVAEPFAVLLPSTVPLVSSSKAHTLVELMTGLAAQVPVCGIDLMFGKLSLRTAASVGYADRLIAYADQRSAETGQAGSLGGDFAYWLAITNTFNNVFFTGAADAAQGKGRFVPDAFYMTAYRRLAADILM